MTQKTRQLANDGNFGVSKRGITLGGNQKPAPTNTKPPTKPAPRPVGQFSPKK